MLIKKPTITITRSALDEFLSSIDKVPEPIVVPEPEVPIQPITPTPNVVDSTQPPDFPIDDENFVPLNLDQLVGSVTKMLKTLKSDKIVEAYQRVKKLVIELNEPVSSLDLVRTSNDHLRSIPKTGSEGPKTGATNAKKPLIRPGMSEAHVRVKKIVREFLKETQISPKSIAALEDIPPAPPEPGHAMEYHEIASALGFSSPSTARMTVEKALLKLKFLVQIPTPQREQMILKGVRDYIDELASSGELSKDEVQLMLDHPTIVASLDGFREFFRKYIMRGMRAAGIKGWDDSEFRKRADFEDTK